MCYIEFYKEVVENFDICLLVNYITKERENEVNRAQL
jgi:hypothetical protein